MKKVLIGIVSFIIILVLIIWIVINNSDKSEQIDIETSEMTATVLAVSDDALTVQDRNNVIYTFNDFETNEVLSVGDYLTLSYTGDIDGDTEMQKASVVECAKLDDSDIDVMMEDKSAFSVFYKQAAKILNKMTLEEKAGQVLLVAAPENGQAELLKEKPYSGYILYKRDFDGKTARQVTNKIKSLQNASKIPLLIAVDEEGGKVVRVGTNKTLVPNGFKSPQELYKAGGMNAIKVDTIDKSKILHDLGINFNLAPVVDVVSDSNAYMYYRSLGESAETTAKYAEAVIEASKGTGVSYTLKHFPGYGNNKDTHDGVVTDNTPYDDIISTNLVPFISGTKAGAEAVLFSHNIVKNVDSSNPASLSASVHNLLRNNVGFSGIAITDDLSMKAITADDAIVKALLAGNDLLILTDSTGSIDKIVSAVKNGTLDEKVVDKAALRVLAWKYYKGLFETK